MGETRGVADRSTTTIPRTAGALADAERLVGAGRAVDAVDLLAAADREHRDPDIEIRLIDLRHLATQTMDTGTGRARWPPTYDDPFPDVRGRLPEVAAADLDTAVLGGAVSHHGALVVRGLFDRERVARTISTIDRTAARRDAVLNNRADSESADDLAWYRPFEPITAQNQTLRRMTGKRGGSWMADSPASTARVLDDLTAARAIDVVTEHFGERPFFSLQKSTLRRSPPVHDLAGWHQDGSFLGPEVRTMNVWLALTPCGGDRPTPGLELVPRRVTEVLPKDGGLGPVSIDEGRVHAVAADTPAIHPEFEPGDALMFDQLLVHRTHLTPNMTEARYAIECWFFAGSHPSPGYVPFLV
jgi:hypothetical protein